MQQEQLKLVDTIHYQKEYITKNKVAKNILTSFVNDEFLTDTQNELKLLSLIYKQINPIMDKYGLQLIFKGGNVMRMIAKNMQYYLEPISNEIVYDVFMKYLKKSDNDFAVIINPFAHNYNEITKEVISEVFVAIEKIRMVLLSNLDYYFEIFKKNEKEIKSTFKDLEKRLNAKKVELSDVYNKFVVFENPKDRYSDVLVYNDTKYPKKFIYNTLNLALEFRDPIGEPIKFDLIRQKINFKVDKSDIPGELIDIAFPDRTDSNFRKFESEHEFNLFMKKAVIKQYNKQYNFHYHVITIDYIIKDLFRILYKQVNLPWDKDKYIKRLARMIYFIFVNHLQLNRLNIKTLKFLNSSFLQFIAKIKGIDDQPNPIKELDLIYFANLNLLNKLKEIQENEAENRENFNDFIDKMIYFSHGIVRITKNLIKYFSGNTMIEPRKIYEIDF